MSCCSTLRSLGSGIRSMFSPSRCYTCPEPEEDEVIETGSFLLSEAGAFFITEDNLFIITE